LDKKNLGLVGLHIMALTLLGTPVRELRITARMLLCAILAICRGACVLIEQPRSSLMPFFPHLLKMVELLKKRTGMKWLQTSLLDTQVDPTML